MGEQFNGVLTLKDGTRITGKKFVHTIAKKLDYWSATNTSTPKVYNNIVGFSDSWAVHRFQLQSAAAGTREIETALPYSLPEIEIESLPVRVCCDSSEALPRLREPAVALRFSAVTGWGVTTTRTAAIKTTGRTMISRKKRNIVSCRSTRSGTAGLSQQSNNLR